MRENLTTSESTEASNPLNKKLQSAGIKIKAKTEAHLANNRILAKKQREKEALLELVQTIFTVVLTVVVVGGGITYTLWWLIKNYS